MSIFGPFRDGSDVEKALLAFLPQWMPTYVAEVRRQKDPDGELWPDGVEPLETFERRHFAAEKWPEDQLPMLLAHCPGEFDDPEQEGEGAVNARWIVVLIAIAEGGGDEPEEDAKELARLYSTAALGAIAQHPDLGGFAEGIAIGREVPYPIRKGVDAERTLMGVEVPYVIEVAEKLNVHEGPLEPLPDPDDPPEDWPRVKEGGGSVRVESGQSKVEQLRKDGFFPPDE